MRPPERKLRAFSPDNFCELIARLADGEANPAQLYVPSRITGVNLGGQLSWCKDRVDSEIPLGYNLA
jgi:hypothetical protein